MTVILKAPRLKIARAREQLQGLEIEFQRFSDRKPYTIAQEHNLETEEFILVYYPSEPIPASWTIILGEIFHNLRSALDNAVYELTVREKGAPLDRTEFPIFDDPVAFSAKKRNGDAAPRSGLYKIRGLHQKTIDCIEALQPYHLTATDQASVLWMVHEMNINDKHREPFICLQLAESTRIELVRDAVNLLHWGIDNLGGNLDERAIIARLKLADGLDDEVYMDADVGIEIAFDKRCFSAFKRNEIVIPMTTKVIRGIEIVLDRLEASVSHSTPAEANPSP